MHIFASTLLILSSLILTGCQKDVWTGFFYPDSSSLLIDENFGNFTTLADCRTAAHIKLQSKPNGDYECGLNCDLSGSKPYVCKATER